MLIAFELDIETKQGVSTEDRILDYLSTWMGQEGYELLDMIDTEGALNRAVGEYVKTKNWKADRVQALVIEDTHNNVIDFLMCRKGGFRWSTGHAEANQYIDFHFYGEGADDGFVAWQNNL